jgi:CHRD domain-containing protein
MRKLVLAALLGAVATALVTGSFAVARGGGDGGNRSFRAPLDGWQEAPSIVTEGEGRFKARLVDDDTIEFWLSYEDLSSAPSQAHIHIGSHHEAGGVSGWLCGAPANTNQGTCPSEQDEDGFEGELHGFIEAEDVTGPANQGVAPREIEDLIRAMRNDEAYANVHTAMFGGGEIRGDLGRGHEREH